MNFDDVHIGDVVKIVKKGRFDRPNQRLGSDVKVIDKDVSDRTLVIDTGERLWPACWVEPSCVELVAAKVSPESVEARLNAAMVILELAQDKKHPTYAPAIAACIGILKGALKKGELS
jgi:hypothetical protein